jgi:ABC transport system ATP-binding/permease protein
VLLVTHDRYFLDQVATSILAFDQATASVVPFADVAQWEGWRAERLAAARAATRKPDAPAPSPALPARRKLGYRDLREYEAIEETIARAEAALRESITESERPEHAADAARLVELLALVDARRAEVDRLYARWAELEAKREGSPAT